MEKEKQVSKKDIEQLLTDQTKAILHAVDKKMDEKVGDFAVLVNSSFEANQKHMDQKFDQIDQNFKQVNANFKQINEKIDNIGLNIVDVVRKEEFNKLESRVVDLEQVAE